MLGRFCSAVGTGEDDYHNDRTTSPGTGIVAVENSTGTFSYGGEEDPCATLTDPCTNTHTF